MLPTRPLCRTHPGGAELCSLPFQARDPALGDSPAESNSDIHCTERKNKEMDFIIAVVVMMQVNKDNLPEASVLP